VAEQIGFPFHIFQQIQKLYGTLSLSELSRIKNNSFFDNGTTRLGIEYEPHFMKGRLLKVVIGFKS